MQPDVSIHPIGNDYSSQVVDLILPIQQLEFHVPTTLEKQPDLLDIDGSYHATGGGFWGAFAEGRLIGTDVHPAGTKLIGTIGLIRVTGPAQNEKDREAVMGVIRKMFVHKDYRGKAFGVAQHLLDTLIDHARSAGIQNLYLGTIHIMQAAARFYTRNGFVELPKTALPEGFPLMAVDDTFYHRPIAYL